MPLIFAPKRQRQADVYEFKAGLVYIPVPSQTRLHKETLSPIFFLYKTRREREEGGKEGERRPFDEEEEKNS